MLLLAPVTAPMPRYEPDAFARKTGSAQIRRHRGVFYLRRVLSSTLPGPKAGLPRLVLGGAPVPWEHRALGIRVCLAYTIHRPTRSYRSNSSHPIFVGYRQWPDAGQRVAALARSGAPRQKS